MSQDKEQADYASAVKQLLLIAKHDICTTQDRDVVESFVAQYPQLLHQALQNGNNLLYCSSSGGVDRLLHNLASKRLGAVVCSENYDDSIKGEIEDLLKAYPSLLITKLPNAKTSTMMMLKDFPLASINLGSVNRAAIDIAKPYLKQLIERQKDISYDHVADLRILVSNYPQLLTQPLYSSYTAPEIARGIYGREMFWELYQVAKNRLIDITVKNKKDFFGRVKEVESLISKYPKLLVDAVDDGTPIVNHVDFAIARTFNIFAKPYLVNLISEDDKASEDRVGCAEKLVILYPKLLTQQVTSYYTALELAQKNYNNEDLLEIFTSLLAKPPADKFCDQSTQTEVIHVDQLGALSGVVLIPIEDDVTN